MRKVTEKEFFNFINSLLNLTTKTVGNYPYTTEFYVYNNLVAKCRVSSYFIITEGEV